MNIDTPDFATAGASKLTRRQFAVLASTTAIASCSPASFREPSDQIRGLAGLRAADGKLIARARVFSDEASLVAFGLDKAARKFGDGALRLSSNPSPNSPRGQLLGYSTASGKGSTFHDELFGNETDQTGPLVSSPDVRPFAEGILRGARGPRNASVPHGYWQSEIVPVRGECLFFSGCAESKQRREQFRSWIVDAGSGFFQFALNETTSPIRHAYGLMIKVRLSWNEAGVLVLQSNAGPGWIHELSIESGPIAPITGLQWGCIAATKPTDIRFSATSVSETGFEAIDRDFYDVGSTTKAVDRARAVPVLRIPDGMFAAQSYARIRYIAEQSLSGPQTTCCWKKLEDRQQDTLSIPITNLAPDTKYRYQFEVSDSSGNVLWMSEIYRFQTL